MRSLIALLALSGAATAAPCRALLNFETGDAGAGRYVVLDLGATGKPLRYRGLAVGDGASVTQLDVVQGAAQQPGFEDRYEVLQTTRGAPTAWLGGPEGIEGSPEPGHGDWDHESSLTVSGVFGPYISVSVEAGGYLGGAHGVDEPSQVTLKDGQPVDIEALVGSAAQTAAKGAIAAETKRRKGWADGPNPAELKLQRAALRAVPGGLHLVKTLFCCSWAENHNRWELDVPVTPPAALADWLPDANGVRPGPARCGLGVQIADRQVVRRTAAGTDRVGAAPGRLLGVAWVDGSAPRLARRPRDAAKATALLKQSRAKMSDRHRLALLEAARQADDQNAEVLAEAGWVAFKLSLRGRAARYTRSALELAGDPVIAARIRYNLGRIYEEQGELQRALGLYAASVAQRPNATVSKRMKAVQDALGQ